MTPRLTPIQLRLSKAYLVEGERPILVDAGCPGEETRIVAALGRRGVRTQDLSLLVHTHGHVDHCGSTKALRALSGAPVMLHAAEVYKMRAGIFGPMPATRPSAWLVHQFVPKHYPGLDPDVVIAAETDLHAWGCAGRLLGTPGHTAGSLTLLLDDGEAIAGDLLMGGYLGGMFRAGEPDFAYFNEDLAGVLESVQALLARGVKRFHVGHGGPLERAEVAAFAERAARRLRSGWRRWGVSR